MQNSKNKVIEKLDKDCRTDEDIQEKLKSLLQENLS
jgi:hypothetical protein